MVGASKRSREGEKVRADKGADLSRSDVASVEIQHLPGHHVGTVD